MGSQDCHVARKKDNTTAGALGVLSSDLGGRTRVGAGEGSLPYTQRKRGERAGTECSRSTLATGCSKTHYYPGSAGSRSGRAEGGWGAALAAYLQVGRKAGAARASGRLGVCGHGGWQASRSTDAKRSRLVPASVAAHSTCRERSRGGRSGWSPLGGDRGVGKWCLRPQHSLSPWPCLTTSIAPSLPGLPKRLSSSSALQPDNYPEGL